jgi:hypothetical protein
MTMMTMIYEGVRKDEGRREQIYSCVMRSPFRAYTSQLLVSNLVLYNLEGPTFESRSED